MRKFCIIVFAIFITYISNAQTSWESVGTLYSGNGVTVKLEYKLKSDSCETNSTKKSKYQYTISGTLGGVDLYLNWKMDYYACNGLVMCQTNSVNIGKNDTGIIVNPEYVFNNSYKIATPFYDVQISSTPDNTPVFSKGKLVSEAPTKIIHDKQIFPGDAAILIVDGGKLGLKAKWVWYKDICFGNPIGFGEKLTVVPQNSATYFVRAEGEKDTTVCVSALIKVSESSIIGDSIKGASYVCVGDKNITLSLIGGKLGKNAEWKWYKDDCTGTSIGSGRTIEVSPIGTTSYFVRAEGKNDLSVCLKKEIVVTDKSTKPFGILGNATICNGESINLSVNGGKLSSGSKWVWYKEFISSNNIIAYGESINFKPNSNTTYVVRGEGVCSNTESVNQIVTVTEVSQRPTAIQVNNTTYTSYLEKRKNTFTVFGGSLSNNAQWTWYKSTSPNGQDLVKIGTGNSIKVKMKKTTTLLVRAEGGKCDNNNEQVSKEYTISKKSTSNSSYTYLNFGLATSAFVTNSNVSPISSPYNAVFTFAKNNSSGVSWYVKGKYSIGGGQANYQTTDAGTITNNTSGATYPALDGKVIEERYGATAGLLFGPQKFRLFLGGGWGKRELKWGVSEYSQSGQLLNTGSEKWASNTDRSYEGYEIETGMLMKLSIFNLQAGVSTITPTLSFNENSSPKELKYFDVHFGIGFNL